MKSLWMISGLVVLCIFENVPPCLGEEDGMSEAIERMKKMGSSLLGKVPQGVINEVLQKTVSFYLPLYAQSEQCRKHSAMVYQSLLNYDLWALQMLDASSKLPPGILEGNIQDLGHYDECLKTSAPGGEFSGQLCIVETKGLSTPEIEKLNCETPRGSLPFRTDLTFSLCIPSSCSADDLKDYLNVAFSTANGTAIVNERSCSTKEPLPYSMADKMTIFALVILFSCIILSTYYEWFNLKEDQRSLLRSFSLTTNIRQLINLNHAPESLTCLNGLRVIAIAWIVMGHRVIHLITAPNFNLLDTAKNLDKFIWAPVQRTDLPVEIFFLLAGTVVTYTFFMDRSKNKPFNYLKFFVKRYIRLTPPLAVMALLYATLLVRASNGPLWNILFGMNQDLCQSNWIWTLSYLNNYVNQLDMCIPNYWYISAVFQMHVISPLLLLPLHKSPRWGILLTIITLFTLIAKTGINFYSNELVEEGLLRSDYRNSTDGASDYYQTEHRSSSFVIGLLVGLFAFKIKQEKMIIKLSQGQIVLGWLVALFLILGPVFSVVIFHHKDYVHVLWVDSIYHSLYRPAVGLGVAWIIFVCTIGQGGTVDKFLSSPQFLPLSRLTYCVYLVHYYIQDIQIFSTRTPIFIDSFSMYYEFFSDIIISHAVAAVLYLTVESPFTNILNYIFKDSKSITDDIPTNMSTLPSFNGATTKKYPP